MHQFLLRLLSVYLHSLWALRFSSDCIVCNWILLVFIFGKQIYRWWWCIPVDDESAVLVYRTWRCVSRRYETVCGASACRWGYCWPACVVLLTVTRSGRRPGASNARLNWRESEQAAYATTAADFCERAIYSAIAQQQQHWEANRLSSSTCTVHSVISIEIPQHENHDICLVWEHFCTKFSSFIQHTILRRPA